MSNNISANFAASFYQNMGQVGKKGQGAPKKEQAQEPFSQYMQDTQVELSADGLALAGQQKAGGTQLSQKAQDLFAKLQEKYGDYDFFVAENQDDMKNYMDKGTKQYSVVFTKEELEKMANDEEYAEKVIGQMESAIGMTKRIEESGQLGEGVHFKQVAITFDGEGNMKLFAQLEKMSADQQERLEEAKEKKAEEKEKAAQEAEKEKKEEQAKKVPSNIVEIEASSEEEFLEKLLGIKW
ncbi:DUF6033 family protein [Selenomonas ruminantium]|uniref:Uncharacterized protein n=1 Tax=Selenomonas ruminantium TaxID=971 RepID=A0A1H3ZPJ8_SELRU|nr:DUF6033 family protein [Selenomonas ruminantium]SEA25182.1 hypothetical protein SAMN05660648_02507 [Selenomonas ruminantium]